MVKSPVASDRDLLFKLFKEAADHSLKASESTMSPIENEAILNIEDLVALYREKIIPLASDAGSAAIDLSFLRDEGFYCL